MSNYELNDVEVTVVKRDKKTGQVLQFRFPNVAFLEIENDIDDPPTVWDDYGYCTYSLTPRVRKMIFNGAALHDENVGCIMEMREIVPAKRKRNK